MWYENFKINEIKYISSNSSIENFRNVGIPEFLLDDIELVKKEYQRKLSEPDLMVEKVKAETSRIKEKEVSATKFNIDKRRNNGRFKKVRFNTGGISSTRYYR